MTRSEIHGGSQTQLHIRVYPKLSKYADSESRVPTVLIDRYCLLNNRTILQGNRLRTGIKQFHVLQMSTYKHTKMEITQVGIRTVLHLRILCHGADTRHKHTCTQYDYLLSHILITYKKHTYCIDHYFENV